MDKKHVFKDTDIFCITCGQAVPTSIWLKRKQRGRHDWDHCIDCTAKPVGKITVHHPALGQIQCYPHKGEVNELWQPLDVLGDLYRPGVRLCGHKDCVNTAHIEKQTVKPLTDLELILFSVEFQAKRQAVR
jgi:hypothetical protein